jgi:hypothetical protein
VSFYGKGKCGFFLRKNREKRISFGVRLKEKRLSAVEAREFKKMQWVAARGQWIAMSAVALGMVLCVGPVTAQQTPAQQTPSQQPAQSDNPFPEDPAKKPAQQQQQQAPGQKPASDNPFPGEDTNAPVLPTDNGSAPTPTPRDGVPRNDSASTAPQKRGADPDGDPVRSPDPTGLQENDGFSSSRSGGPDLGMDDSTDPKSGKPVKVKTREEIIKEDVDVGGFYTEKKNWKAAQARFASAFEMDKENPDAVWGLAESERHLAMYKEAAVHYQLFLTYDPDGPHGKAARKGLEEVQALVGKAGK